MKVSKQNIPQVSYARVLKWAKKQAPTLPNSNSILIPKYGGRSKTPFRLWVFADSLLLMSSEEARRQSQYILDREKWERFCEFVKKNPGIGTSELAKRYKEYGCTNYLFWPSIISICKKYHNL